MMRVAIVGCGRAARWHMDSYKKLPGKVIVAALCDSNEAAAEIFASENSIPHTYTNITEMLKREQLDVIDICTPPVTHLQLVKTALESGHNVLVEKPLALSLADAETLIHTAESNHVRLCVVHNELFLPVVMRTREMITKGELGEIKGIHISDGMPVNDEIYADKNHWCHHLPGGIFAEMIPHPLYLAQAFMGDLKAVSIVSKKTGQADWIKADELRVVLEGEKGLATISESVNVSKDIMVLEIIGTNAMLQVDIWGSVITGYGINGRGRLSRGLENVTHSFQRLNGTAGTVFSIVSGKYRSGHNTLIRHFVEALADGSKMPVSVAEMRQMMQLYESVITRI